MINHEALMRRAIAMADTARHRARPNPWVGAVIVCADGREFSGATSEPGGPHAEIVALRAAQRAGASTVGATLYSTLEPCSHTGRTGPCTDALIQAGVSRVVIGVEDPDPLVAGSGITQLREAGIDVITELCAHEVAEQLAAYLHHRRTGRPFVMLKMACTLDARVTMPAPHDERWITGDIARTRVHALRAESDAIVVGAGTVRADNPALTVRHVDGPSPRRIVLASDASTIPSDAAVHPCTVWTGALVDLLDMLGAEGVIQLMVEGGPTVARSFHDAGLINRYVLHLAPIVSGDASLPTVFSGAQALTADELTALSLKSVSVLGNDIELVYEPLHQKVSAS